MGVLLLCFLLCFASSFSTLSTPENTKKKEIRKKGKQIIKTKKTRKKPLSLFFLSSSSLLFLSLFLILIEDEAIYRSLRGLALSTRKRKRNKEEKGKNNKKNTKSL